MSDSVVDGVITAPQETVATVFRKTVQVPALPDVMVMFSGPVTETVDDAGGAYSICPAPNISTSPSTSAILNCSLPLGESGEEVRDAQVCEGKLPVALASDPVNAAPAMPIADATTQIRPARASLARINIKTPHVPFLLPASNRINICHSRSFSLFFNSIDDMNE
ncbi:MAG: hypothetical protein KDJ55_06620 [Rhodobiaceae bacterium]|nr:hypothetical protein [Rhodobiaceae bacterium]